MRPSMSITSRNTPARPPPGGAAAYPPLATRSGRFALPAGAIAALIGANLVLGRVRRRQRGRPRPSATPDARLPAGVRRVDGAPDAPRQSRGNTGHRPMRPALLGLTGVAIFCASQNLGLGTASAGTSALLNGAIPVLTGLLAVVCLGERPGRVPPHRIPGLPRRDRHARVSRG